MENPSRVEVYSSSIYGTSEDMLHQGRPESELSSNCTYFGAINQRARVTEIHDNEVSFSVNAGGDDSSSVLEPNAQNEQSIPPGHVVSSDSHEDSRDTITNQNDNLNLSGDEEPDIPSTAPSISENLPKPSWEPDFLRKASLISLIVLMVVFSILITTLYTLSRYNNGFLTASSEFYYFWRFGPVAGTLYIKLRSTFANANPLPALTLTSLLWSRVEIEGLRYSPWVKLLRDSSAPVSKTLSLNYFSTFKPFILRKAAKLGDWIVFSLVLITFLLQLQTIIAASLFALEEIEVLNHGTLINVTNEFVDDLDPRIFLGWQPSKILRAITSYGVPYPEGTGPGFAYQIFEDLNESSDSLKIQAEVDIIRSDVDCKLGDILSYKGWYEVANQKYYEVLSGHVPQCSQPFTISVSTMDRLGSSGYSIYYADYANSQEGPSCEQDIVHFVYWKTDVPDPNSSKDSNTTLAHSAVVACKLGATVSSARVLKNTTDASYELESVSNSRPSPFNIVQLIHNMGSFMNDPINDYNQTHEVSTVLEPEIMNQQWFDLFPIQPLEKEFQLSSLADGNYALDFVERSWSQIIPLTAQYLAMRPTSKIVTGSTLVKQRRLMVPTLQFSVMISLFILIVACAIYSIWSLPRVPFASRDPATLISPAILLASKPGLRDPLLRYGNSTSEEIEKRVEKCDNHLNLKSLVGDPPLPARHNPLNSQFLTNNQTESSDEGTIAGNHKAKFKPRQISRDTKWHNPWQLLLVTRVAFVCVLAALASITGYTWTLSQKRQGLVDIGESLVGTFVWTSIPTIIAVIIGAYVTASFLEVRVVAPFSLLRQGVNLRLMTASMNDYFTALRGGSSPLAQSALFLTMLSAAMSLILTPYGGILYQEEYISRESPVRVQQEEWFSTTRPAPITINTTEGILEDKSLNLDVSLISGLIFFRNYSFPAWTYEDLVFPNLTVVDMPHSHSSNLSMEVRVPALRPELACETLGMDAINTTVRKVPEDEYGAPGVLRMSITPKAPLDTFGSPVVSFVTCDNIVFAGRNDIGDFGNSSSNRAYSWGRLEKGKVRYLKWVMCKLEYVEVDVDLTLLLPSYEIDKLHPPRPIESSKRKSSPLEWQDGDEKVSWDYIRDFTVRSTIQDPNISPCKRRATAGGGDANAALYNSPWGLPYESLLDDSKHQAVANLWKKLNTMVIAQMISHLGYRKSFHANGTTAAADAPSQPKPLEGTLTDHKVKVLKQSPVATWVVIGILSAMALATMGSIVAERSFKEVLPRDPRSIASMLALWADSNIWTQLPEGVDSMADKDLGSWFAGKVFRAGWANVADEGSEDRVYAIHVEGEHSSEG